MEHRQENQLTNLREIVDLEHLQWLQDTFANVTGITTAIIDPDGTQLTRPSNVHGFCQRIQSDPKGAEKCLATNVLLCEKNRKTRQPVIMTCPHSGLQTAAVPIMLEDRHLASWIIGQAKVQPPSSNLLAKTAAELGANPAELAELVDQLPQMDGDEFERIFKFLQSMSEIIVKLGVQRHQTEQKNEALKEMSRQQEATANMMREFVDASDIGMYVTDYYTGELLMVNRNYAQNFNVQPQALIGQKCWEVGGPQGTTTFCSYCPRDKLLDDNGEPARPYHWENFNPLIQRWLRITNQAITWTDGRLAHMVTFLDVTDEHILREELSRLAYYDKQMALPNRTKLLQDMVDADEQPGQYLVCFDVTALRRVNDVYGRDTGDLLLEKVVEWIRRQDFGLTNIYRIEGDEFGLHFIGSTSQHAQEVAYMICDRFNEPWVLDVQGQEISVMCGVVTTVISKHDGLLGEKLISLIERMLDLARAGDGLAVYNEEADKASKAHIRMELSLKNCIQNEMQGFDVYFQPIVDPGAGTWKGLEALCRWTDPESGPVSPVVFIKEAEQLGLIRKIGIWVLERAIERCKHWKLDEVKGFFLSVNLSPDQVMENNFVEKVTGLLKKYEFPGNCLALEVTESTEFTFNNISMNVINKLRFFGIRFSLDDFGTGYSSFNNLKNLPVSMLKTEREFIWGIEEDSYMQYFFYSMAELAHAADMNLIAEGIETRQQLEIVLKNGADYLQGYYFSKPLPATELASQLDKFTQVDASFYDLGGERFNAEQLFAGKDAYMISPALFSLLSQSMHLLLTGADMAEAFDEVLQLVGEKLKVNRAYIYLKERGNLFDAAYQWQTSGMDLGKTFWASRIEGKTAEAWLHMLEKKGMIVAGDTSKLPDAVGKELVKQHAKAVAVLPMYDDYELIGFLGLDSLRFREWLPEEVVMLRNLAMTIGNTIKRDHLQTQVLQQNIRFADVLNHMNLAIVVTDPVDDTILWANGAVGSLYDTEGVVIGQPCYEALQGCSSRCEFCQKHELLAENAPHEITWEYYNERLDRDFMVNDSLVRWEGGKKAHLQYTIDISDVKRFQRKLEYFASTDAMTDTQNRNSLIETLHAHLKTAEESNQSLSIVFIDIDRMKYANDTYGHGFGDELIKTTVEAVRRNTHGEDIIGRYGGDEFIVLMPNCNAEKAKQLMEAAREQVKKLRYEPFDDEFTFSFGVVENTELPFEDSERIVNVIINLADDRMRDQKKANKAGRGA